MMSGEVQFDVDDALKNWMDQFIAMRHSLERSADELWQAVDQSPLCRFNKINEPYVAITSARGNRRAALDVLSSLRSIVDSWNAEIDHLEETIGEFDCHIERMSWEYCLSCLPDELLELIFFYATEEYGVKAPIALSHVCRRFRLIILGSRRIWHRYPLNSDWSPQMILGVAERQGFQSLKANVDLRSSKAVMLIESIKSILDLRPYLSFLRIHGLTALSSRFIRDYLNGSEMPSLCRLSIYRGGKEGLSSTRVLEELCSMPSLTSLEIRGFVPNASLAKHLVRCDLYLWSEVFLEDLFDFLSSATSLETLVVRLWGERCLFLQRSANHVVPISLPKLASLEISSDLNVPNVLFLLEKFIPFAIQRITVSVHASFDTDEIFGFTK